MFKEYKNGRTPNPDVLCNREIKFDVFLEAAKKLNADFVATGHYCRKDSFEKEGKTIYRLLAGEDKNKDQSYFLCQLNQTQLGKALFPIGNLEKSEVRRIASELNLVTADKKDSQGLCFIGKVKLPDFLQQQLKVKIGDIIEIEKESEIFEKKNVDLSRGKEQELMKISDKFDFSNEERKVVGQHQGAHYFTIGQRKGLNVGGTKEALYVIDTDTLNNVIYVGQGSTHPGLKRFALRVAQEDIHWLRSDLTLKVGETADYLARIRYRQNLSKVKLYRTNEFLFVVFEEVQIGIASGQFVAWYMEDELIGSGVIQ
jgi:tRNA-specific 2-thiouridylase